LTDNPELDDTTRLVAFVRRLRRIAAHPLIAADGGESMRDLASSKFKMVVFPQTGDVIMKHEVPEEVLFESMAARLRPMTLTRDDLAHKKVMQSLEACTDTSHPRVAVALAKMRADWAEVTVRDARNPGKVGQAFNLVSGNLDGAEVETMTDVDLAYAWLYGDCIHGDVKNFGGSSSRDRYHAATSVFARIAVVAMGTLEYIRHLVDEGLLSLPEEAFTDAVVVSETYWETKGKAYASADGTVPDLGAIADLASVPTGMIPIHDAITPHLEPLGDDE